MAPEDDTTTTDNSRLPVLAFLFFTTGQKYHAVAKSTRKCMSLTCSVVNMHAQWTGRR